MLAWPQTMCCMAFYGCGLDRNWCMFDLPRLAFLQLNQEHYLDEFIQELRRCGRKHNQLSTANVIMAKKMMCNT